MSRSGRQLVAASIAGVGALVMIAGTFAPWLYSGQVTRDSYRTAGLLQRLLDVGGAAGDALDAVPLFALLCAATAIVFVLGWRRTAGGVLAVLALAMGALSVAALVAPAAGDVRVATAGPLIVLIGAILSILTGIALVLLRDVDKTYRDS